MLRMRLAPAVLVAMLLSLCMAADAGRVNDIVAEISQADYTDYLGHYLGESDFLYTGLGDNRGVSGAQHDLARQNIYDEFAGFGLDTSYHDFVWQENTYSNVVAVHTGALDPDDIYILGAHFDSVNNPGADDNASGVAGMLEAASVLSQHEFAATIIFIAFDREEQGLVGSWAYYNDHIGDNILGMIAMDMIAYNPEGDAHDQVRVHSRTSSRPHGHKVCDCVDLYSGGLTADRRGRWGVSDHWPFESDHVFQSCLMIEGACESNPHYHQAADSVDTPGYIDYVYAYKVTRSATGFMAKYAGATPEPGSLVMFTVGLGLLALARRRRDLGRP